MRTLFFLSRGRKLTLDSDQVLRLLAAGGTLKAHRTLDGKKAYRLHPLRGPSVDIPATTIEQLKRCRLIDSNMKFPAAVYLLTAKGRQAVAALGERTSLPLGSERF